MKNGKKLLNYFGHCLCFSTLAYECFCSCIYSTVQMVAGQIQKLSLFS